MFIYEGNLISEGRKYAIVISRFNEFINAKLLNGALDGLKRHGVSEKEIEIYWVPGAFEIPVAAKKIAMMGKADAIICLGTVIRGATSHYELVSAEVAKGIASVGLEFCIPAVFGVVTAENLEQAIERAGTKAGNKGFDAATAAIEMANLMSEIN